MKLHIGCGDIYLEGYMNIDTEGIDVDFCTYKEHKKNITTLNRYFKYPFGSKRRSIIIDKKMDITKSWSFSNNSIDEIVMISVIEHITHEQAKFVAKEIKRVLKKGGKVLLSFPNILHQVAEYYDKDPEFCMELIYCNHKNPYSIHHWGYTEKTIQKLLGNGFSYTFRPIVNHDYPMIGVEARKK